MKNLPLIWNALLTIAVAFLGYKYMSPGSAAAEKSAASGSNLAYVNTDSLLTKYDYYKDVTKDLDQKIYKLQNDLAAREKSLQNEAAVFQQRVQQGGMTEEQAKTQYAQLQQKGANLQQSGAQEEQKLMAERTKKTDELLTKIQTFLKNYNKTNPFDMVIGYSKGGGVLYAKENLDITNKVIEGLNAEYKSTKTSK